MDIVDGTRNQMLEAIQEAHASGKFIYAMKSLAGGNFVPEREEALRFVFGQETIDAAKVNHDLCILCGYCAPHCKELAIRFV